MRRFILGLVVSVSACAISNVQPPDSGDGGSGSDAQIDASLDVAPDVDTTHGTLCGQLGRACTSTGDCCSGECAYDRATQQSYCFDPPIVCAANGKTCLINDECCSNQCTNGTCATACAENGMDCSNTACCQGSCSQNVCEFGVVGCKDIGAACTANGSCCSGSCTNGACGASACVARGSACTSPTDCCSGTCTNGACTTAPTCAWKGQCAGNFACCGGTCGNTGQCELPVGKTACRFLEKSPDSDFAECFDCIATSCCDAQSNAPIDWQACFQDCMSSLSTWDEYGACVSSCKSKVGPPPDALSACVTNSCATACAQ